MRQAVAGRGERCRSPLEDPNARLCVTRRPGVDVVQPQVHTVDKLGVFRKRCQGGLKVITLLSGGYERPSADVQVAVQSHVTCLKEGKEG